MERPIVIEKFADNGEHSHWELIRYEDGKVLWIEKERTGKKKIEPSRKDKKLSYSMNLGKKKAKQIPSTYRQPHAND